VGLVYAAHLARRLGRIDDARVQQHYDVVQGAYELDTALPPGLDPQQLVRLMGLDKKVLDGGLTFVLDSERGPEVVKGVDADAALAALGDMR
jgi:5-deoxy-5-amino-3-dehydroquinate synthase